MASAVTRAKRELRLDGIRGIAVLLVLLYHATTPVRVFRTDTRLLPGGWVGVDVFFVLSGYLITRLLVAELDARGRIDARAFYRRRVRRLLPALAVLLAAWLAVTQAGVLTVEQLGSPPYTDQALAFVPVVGAFVLGYNWLLAFDLPTPAGMGHLWTLSVEEQFYVVWLVVVVLAARIARPRRVLFPLALAAGAGSLLLTALEASGSRDFAYFASPTAGFGLFVGAGAALAPQLRAGAVTALGGLGVVAACALVVPDTAREVLAVSVAGTCIGTAMLIHARGSRVDRFLELSWLRYAGRRSYAMYLWSSPLAYATVTWLGQTWAAVGVLLAATIVLSELSWRLVERRFLVAGRARVERVAAEPLAAQT